MKIKTLISVALALVIFSRVQITFAQKVDETQGNFIFSEQITPASVLELTTTLEDWSSENPDLPIRITLNSPGGDVLASFALVDELNHLRNKGHKLTIAVYGMAASAAA